MSIISVSDSGNFKNIESFLEAMDKGDPFSFLDSYGQLGVDALSETTPKDSGETASSWYYTVDAGDSFYSITWHNDHIAEGGIPIAVLIQFGHATRNGGYVQGIDYINPAMMNVFKEIAEAIWKEVQNA